MWLKRISPGQRGRQRLARMKTVPRLVDLSHPIESGMAVYPGLPSPRIEPLLSHAASRDSYGGQAEFSITRIFLVGNTGTCLDSPWHRHADGPDIGELPLEAVAGLDGTSVDGHLREGRAVVIERPAAELTGKAVLVRTGWDRHWGTAEYWLPGPFLARDTIDLLVAARAGLIGVDFWNVDDPANLARPAHTDLLAAGIPIVEHLHGLDALPRSGFRFHAVPPAVRRAGSFPVRAFAEVGEPE
jgi:arylformamidase